MVYVAEPEARKRSADYPERLDGWKSIAAYLKRDRTTVIRWTRERGLPVHRLPGGQTGTVYALRHELDRWAGMPGAAPVIEPVVSTDPAPIATLVATLVATTDAGRARPHRRWVAGLAAIALGVGMPMVIARGKIASSATSPVPTPTATLPRDPAIARNFLAARDLVADRKAHGLERAIAVLETVVRAAPGYAPGHAALAEALLLSREFGMRPDAEAFSQARLAAQSAVRIAPTLADGHRILGFLAYWADQDFAESEVHFRQALRLNPNDAQSHFWFGNILSDHGAHTAGLQALDQARLLQPGSVAIATDLAWAQWAAGQDAVAKTALNAIVANHPDFAVAFDALSIVALAEGDFAGYARHFTRYADLKQDDRLMANARAIAAAMRVGAADGRQEILRQALAEAAQDRMRSHAWPALIASASGDRERLAAILRAADRRLERWEAAGFTLQIARAWRNDPEIAALLARRSA